MSRGPTSENSWNWQRRSPSNRRVREYPLEDANRALAEIKSKDIRGAKVLKII